MEKTKLGIRHRISFLTAVIMPQNITQRHVHHIFNQKPLESDIWGETGKILREEEGTFYFIRSGLLEFCFPLHKTKLTGDGQRSPPRFPWKSAHLPELCLSSGPSIWALAVAFCLPLCSPLPAIPTYHSRLPASISFPVHGSMPRWVDGCMDGQTRGWMGGCMDKSID